MWNPAIAEEESGFNNSGISSIAVLIAIIILIIFPLLVRAAGEGFEGGGFFTVAFEAVSTVEASAGAEASAEEAVLAEAEAVVLAAEAPARGF